MSELTVGDRVRVKPLAALGTILRVSARLRHAPYLVAVEGYGEHAYAATDLAKVQMATPLPAQAAPAGWVQCCGVCGAVLAGGRCVRCQP